MTCVLTTLLPSVTLNVYAEVSAQTTTTLLTPWSGSVGHMSSSDFDIVAKAQLTALELIQLWSLLDDEPSPAAAIAPYIAAALRDNPADDLVAALVTQAVHLATMTPPDGAHIAQLLTGEFAEAIRGSLQIAESAQTSIEGIDDDLEQLQDGGTSNDEGPTDDQS